MGGAGTPAEKRLRVGKYGVSGLMACSKVVRMEALTCRLQLWDRWSRSDCVGLERAW